jgi:hypothetical protein
VISLFLIFVAVSTAQAQSYFGTEDLSLSFERDVKRAHFSLGSEVMTLSSPSASIMGLGPRVGFEYGLSDRWSAGANLVFAFQGSGKPGAFFYSGITGMARYAFQGSSVKSTSIIRRKDGSEVYSSNPVAKRRWTALLGIEQLFLNGASSIYPAIGTTAGVGWGFGFWGQEAELDIRYSMLTANDNPITMIAIGANINLDF